MKTLPFLFTVFASTTLIFSHAQKPTLAGKVAVSNEANTWVVTDSTLIQQIQPIQVEKLELPKLKSDEIVISHVGYSFVYNEAHEQASWVAYELTSDETNQTWARTDRFVTDPYVKTGTANAKDYAGSGYDRGHLAPAADMGWSSAAMAESFYFSNMSPQEPGFNRGIWKRLEELTRTWAVNNIAIYVVTGPVLTAGLTTIGMNEVSVPNYYYKIILDYTEPGIKGIGFILPNGSSTEPLQNYAVTIDSVEKFTGIDFFPLLPHDQENLIERYLNLNAWSWTNSKSTNGNKNATVSVQCNGLTKAGARCKNRTVNPSGYCYLHEGQSDKNTNQTETEKNATSVQCKGITKAGERCKHMTYNSSGFCFQHENQNKK